MNQCDSADGVAAGPAALANRSAVLGGCKAALGSREIDIGGSEAGIESGDGPIEVAANANPDRTPSASGDGDGTLTTNVK